MTVDTRYTTVVFGTTEWSLTSVASAGFQGFGLKRMRERVVAPGRVSIERPRNTETPSCHMEGRVGPTGSDVYSPQLLRPISHVERLVPEPLAVKARRG
jgi:hypothetical protein